MLAYFMRHGQTNYNRKALCNSDPDIDVHLTAEGRKQASAASHLLADIELRNIIVSRLPRTRQTAEIVNQAHGVPILVHAGIDDIRSGCEGRPVQEYQAAIAHDPMHARIRDGESLYEHRARVVNYLHWLPSLKTPTTLTIAHEETLRVIVAHFERLTDEEMRALHFDNCQIVSYPLPSTP